MNVKQLFIIVMLTFTLIGCEQINDKPNPKEGLEINRLEAENAKLKAENEALKNSGNINQTDTGEVEYKDENKKSEEYDLKKKIEELEKEVKEADDVINALNKEISQKNKEIEKEKAAKKEREKYTGESFITLMSPTDNTEFRHAPIVFTGNVSPNTEKVVATASGYNNSYKDVYELKNFKAGDTSFKYQADIPYNNLEYGTNQYEFKAYFSNGNTKTTNVTIFFVEGGGEMGKPVIYLYPEETTDVFVNVEPTNGISVSDPAINNGWNVTASPDGKLVNHVDGKTYPYLFWEGYAANFKTPSEGFVIDANDTEKFFDTKLAQLGLNKNEIKDFKEFWIPELAKETSPYLFITFIDQDTFNTYAPLTVEPKPDSLIRVFFDYKTLDKKINVKEQILTTPKRDGFTVVEWGGRLY